MRRLLQAALLPLAVGLAVSLPACGDDPPPVEPVDDGGTTLTIATCIDCHASEEALKDSAAPVAAAEGMIIAAGDG